MKQRVEQLEVELAEAKRELEWAEQRRQAQLKIAARVHESLLPRPVRRPWIDVDTRYVPQEGVGGDYCQVLFPSESCCYVTMCDVTGHGIGPALLATRVSSEVRHLVGEQLRPVQIVESLNAFIFEHFRDTQLQLSFFVARLDREAHTLTYSGAGHPGPLLIRHGSGPIEILQSQNLLIGIAEQCLSDPSEGTVTVNRGDRVLFFTDGLTETWDAAGILLGTEGLARIAAIACSGGFSEMADRILQRIATFRRGPLEDDMTMIIAKLKE